ncbi:response regulator [Candidatus Bipolaricaulota bacterium]|nr:response regulator [Candidatus Bipolaricaulota bacterium]
MSKKVLCVDDDLNILNAYRRGLRRLFEIETAPGGPEGLKAIASQGPFAVVVSDMRMPGMDGIKFLTAVKKCAPESVRIMLTGNADQQTAIDAVNEGSIFRFLTKPCPPEHLAKTLTAGIEQYDLITAEKELLGKTLKGAIKLLSEVLSLTNPTAFGHASRVRNVVRDLCKELKVPNPWLFEIAAMLSQIGCVTIPPETLAKVQNGEEFTADEAKMFESHPKVGCDLVAHIPRLENVSQIIAYQQKRFDGSGPPSGSVAGDDIPLGARILKVALDYDALKWSGLSDADVMLALSEREGWYDAQILEKVGNIRGPKAPVSIRSVRMRELNTTMTLVEDVTTVEGSLVVGKGQEVTHSLCERLKNFSRHRDIKEPIRVMVRNDG